MRGGWSLGGGEAVRRQWGRPQRRESGVSVAQTVTADRDHRERERVMTTLRDKITS